MFSSPKPQVKARKRQRRGRVEPRGVVEEKGPVQPAFNAEVRGNIVCQGNRQNVLVPDMTAGENYATVPDLRILDSRSSSPDKSYGFNPYDTAELHMESNNKPR